MKVIWTTPALNDLDEIRAYIAKDDPKVAQQVVLELIARTKPLRRLTGLGRPGRVAGTRELVASPWVIAYRVRDGVLRVLRVLHGSRKWPAKFSAKRRA